jgi:hypothetical protein
MLSVQSSWDTMLQLSVVPIDTGSYCRLWKAKLPDCCNHYALSSPFTNWLVTADSHEKAAKFSGMAVGKHTLHSYKELACEVGKCVHTCKVDESKSEEEQAAAWSEIAVNKWNTGTACCTVRASTCGRALL